jgi:hypothetical protein
MGNSEQEPHYQHFETPEAQPPATDGDREPQLNCTVCGRKSGFNDCLCNGTDEDGSETDKTDGNQLSRGTQKQHFS